MCLPAILSGVALAKTEAAKSDGGSVAYLEQPQLFVGFLFGGPGAALQRPNQGIRDERNERGGVPFKGSVVEGSALCVGQDEP